VAKAQFGGLHVLMNVVGANNLVMLPEVDLEQWNKVSVRCGPRLASKRGPRKKPRSGAFSIAGAGFERIPATAYRIVEARDLA
jgi:hypothetical protein